MQSLLSANWTFAVCPHHVNIVKRQSQFATQFATQSATVEDLWVPLIWWGPIWAPSRSVWITWRPWWSTLQIITRRPLWRAYSICWLISIPIASPSFFFAISWKSTGPQVIKTKRRDSLEDADQNPEYYKACRWKPTPCRSSKTTKPTMRSWRMSYVRARRWPVGLPFIPRLWRNKWFKVGNHGESWSLPSLVLLHFKTMSMSFKPCFK